MSKIEINSVYKIFGSNPKSILSMVKEGSTKEEILEKTGHTVGLDNVSLKIEEGETFVCMGLSGSGKSTLIRHLNRLIDPTAGDILIEGTNVMSLNKKELIDWIERIPYRETRNYVQRVLENLTVYRELLGNKEIH